MTRTGIIGGTGIYDPDLFEVQDEVRLSTPYGPPSDDIVLGTWEGREVAFLPRHGKGHVHPPHMVNYRANLWALKVLGVTRVVSPCAVGSLQEEYRPGEIVLVDQFIDLTKKREYTFYDGRKTVHIGTADPFCPELSNIFARKAGELDIPHHESGTYVCIEGPRFSTRAESRMFRSFADVIGMTLVPECQLAREMEMCYLSLGMITDYDVWAEEPVDAATVKRTMAENIQRIRDLLSSALPEIPLERERCDCPHTLEQAGA
ncbi:MAG: S-methyl-5'-thioadenosine phosphorylase [Methanomassiliicoccales archaeon]